MLGPEVEREARLKVKSLISIDNTMMKYKYILEDLLDTFAALDFRETLGDEGGRFFESKTRSFGMFEPPDSYMMGIGS